MPSSLIRFRPVVLLACVLIAVGAVLRCVLWWQFGLHSGVAGSTLPGLLAAGVVNDAVASLYAFAPLALYLLLVPDSWFRRSTSRWILYVGTYATLVGLLYLAILEFYFFEEFDARLNLVAFDYLLYPHEVFTDIWESYPVVRVLLIALAGSAAVFAALRPALLRVVATPSAWRGRLAGFGVHALCLTLAAGVASTDLLSLFGNRVANEIASNGVSSFFRAARTSDIDYGTYYLTNDSRRNLQLLAEDLGRGGGQFTRLSEGRLDRRFAPDPKGLGKLNVVVVMEESFGAEFSKLHGSPRDWTPNFDAFARQGLWFSRAYASGTRTVRGLEAITTSLPPIPTVSILRRPGNEGVANWGQVMREQGYHASFLYGGYGYFDNMNYFYSNNGFEVIDRTSIAEPRFENIWGVADEDLFDRALGYYDQLAQRRQPFFSMVMTTSNHKPFTFRSGIPGVKPERGGREAGVRYADFALGYFLREARKHPWFDDTVFVVVADHGARVYGRAEIPLRTYEIPYMIYAPAHLQPRTIDTLTTQIDIAPTVLGLLGLGYEAPFFGQNVLAHPDESRVVFFSHNHDVALLRDGVLSVLGLQKTLETFRYQEGAETYTKVPDAHALAPLAIAYYQTASELFKSRTFTIDPRRTDHDTRFVSNPPSRVGPIGPESAP